ncbi:3'-5' exonuclease [Streptomyces sp. NPDC017979]|uniref:3'-5' exonuclease n=1 Tax=Streptomyces sp. NPDC017979 TaxID=3365024 RepID=UPI00378DDE36
MAAVRRELADDPGAGTYAAEITREALRLLEPGAAVVLDTETTSLLMDTLVKPTTEITPEARWVHGISDEDVANARPFDKVLPKLRTVTKDRTVCAYNADFDRTVVLGDIARAGKKPMHLEPFGNWYCLMEAYAAWLGSRRWLRLGGGHRALGDAQAARTVLIEMSKGRGTEFAPRPPAPGRPRARRPGRYGPR